MWHWLIENGLYHSLIDAVVVTIVGGSVSLLFRRPVRRLGEQQKEIESHLAKQTSLLDARTPGGLGDVVAAIREEGEE